MRIYEGSPRQDFEEVFRSIGAFLDQRAMKDVLLMEAPDGFIVQGLVTSGASTSAWSDSLGSQSKETLTFLDDDIARFMEEDVFFFEQGGAFVVRLLMPGQQGNHHELSEFTKEDIDELVARGPALRQPIVKKEAKK